MITIKYTYEEVLGKPNPFVVTLQQNKTEKRPLLDVRPSALINSINQSQCARN